MKDVTVALELVVPESATDQQIKSFVEAAIRDRVEAHRKQLRETGHLKYFDPSFDWSEVGLPASVEEPIEVTGIADGSHWLTPSGIKLEDWRMFDAGGFLGDSGDSRDVAS